ncbi:MAG: hypothetical protein ACFFFB_00075 [Candidatus Heimdallarchaeota archaeon]
MLKEDKKCIFIVGIIIALTASSIVYPIYLGFLGVTFYTIFFYITYLIEFKIIYIFLEGSKIKDSINPPLYMGTYLIFRIKCQKLYMVTQKTDL